ncbi:MAG TPA: YceI family protein [Flavobacteriaceae bacterium]|nr:YceI family protein [Flavobacteriaceae bacterium]
MATMQHWKVDKSHSEIAFKVRHMMISTVSGNFTDFDASVQTDNDKFINADFQFSAKIESINTNNTDRDNHLRSGDFFDAENHPEMTFRSKEYDGEKMVGDLTIRGITKEVTLNVDLNGVAQDPYGQTKAGFEITGEVNRKDFNLSWNAVTEAGSIVVSDKVRLLVDLQFIKQ